MVKDSIRSRLWRIRDDHLKAWGSCDNAGIEVRAPASACRSNIYRTFFDSHFTCDHIIVCA